MEKCDARSGACRDAGHGEGSPGTLLDPCTRSPPLIAELLALPRPRQRLAVREQLAMLGFGGLEVAETTLGGRDFRTVQAWRDLSFPMSAADAATGSHDDDPRLAFALAPLPSVWDRTLLEAGRRPASPSPWLASLRAAQIASGLSLAVRDGPSTVRVVSLLSATPGRHWISNGVAGRASLIALFVGQIGDGPTVEARPPGPADDDLTRTQRDVLDCVCRGLPDKLIADRLGMSPHNVDYHLRRLRQRFGARNRVQLAQIARVAT